MLRFRLALTALLALCGAGLGKLPEARAGEAATLTRQFLETGKLDEGQRALAARLAANAGDEEARFGLGMVLFARAIETFGQHHYRHGLQPAAGSIFPFLRMPVPMNPQPERLTYEAQRAALQRFL